MMMSYLEMEQSGSKRLYWNIFQRQYQLASAPLVAALWWKSVTVGSNTLADILKSKVTTVGLNGRPKSMQYISLGLFGSEVERWEEDEDGYGETDLRHPGNCLVVLGAIRGKWTRFLSLIHLYLKMHLNGI